MSVGDDQALAELQGLYEADLDKFVRTASAITGDPESGRDAVHDAFIAAIRGRERFRGEASVEAWMWRIVVNAALKARSRRGEVAPGDDAAETASVNGHGEEAAAIRVVIAELPERQRLVLFLRYYADLDYEQIAEALSIKAGTVGATLHAAHATLRSRLVEVSRR